MIAAVRVGSSSTAGSLSSSSSVISIFDIVLVRFLIFWVYVVFSCAFNFLCSARSCSKCQSKNPLFTLTNRYLIIINLQEKINQFLIRIE